MSIEIGAPAPQFALRDQHLEVVTRDDLAGRAALVVFIPNPFTSVCEAELCSIRDGLAALNDLDAEVVAVTCNTPFVNKRWSDDNGFTFRVLSDFWPHGEVSKAFGAFNERFGIPNRHTYVLDAEGTVRDIITSESLGEAREFDRYVASLSSI
jgi:peroxiredoxin